MKAKAAKVQKTRGNRKPAEPAIGAKRFGQQTREIAVYRKALCELYDMTKGELNGIVLDALCQGDKIAGSVV